MSLLRLQPTHLLLLVPMLFCILLLIGLTSPIHCNSSYSIALCGERCKGYEDCELVRNHGVYFCIANEGLYYREVRMEEFRLCLIGVMIAVYLGIMVHRNSRVEGEYEVLITNIKVLC